MSDRPRDADGKWTNASHAGACECVMCAARRQTGSMEAAMAEHRAWADGQIAQHGWYAHYVGEDPSRENTVNFHTHGFLEKHGHPDFQIALPIPVASAHNIFWKLWRAIAAGRRYQVGEIVTDLLGNGYHATFIDAEDNGRHVLRLIVPDRDGHLQETTNPWFMRQFRNLADPYEPAETPIVPLPSRN